MKLICICISGNSGQIIRKGRFDARLVDLEEFVNHFLDVLLCLFREVRFNIRASQIISQQSLHLLGSNLLGGLGHIDAVICLCELDACLDEALIQAPADAHQNCRPGKCLQRCKTGIVKIARCRPHCAGVRHQNPVAGAHHPFHPIFFGLLFFLFL